MMTWLPSIFAFGFAGPLFLVGTGLAAAPIIIHLLNRRRFKRLDWAAMEFLLRAEELNRRRIRVEQLLLLIIRTLLVLLFVLALARPYLTGAIGGGGLGEPVHRIIVMDLSGSMQYKTGRKTVRDTGIAYAGQIIDQSGGGDELNLLLMKSPPELVHKTASGHVETVRNDLRRLAVPMQTTADVVATLSALKEAIESSPIRHKEIYWITDCQKKTFKPEDSPATRDRITKMFREVGERCNLTFIDVGQPKTKNLGIQDFELTTPVVTPNKPVHFEATIVNYGTAPEQVTVQMQVDDEEPSAGQTFTCEVRTPKAITFSCTFDRLGQHTVCVRLADGDPLPIDDERFLVVDVKKQVNVLCINGESGRRAKDNETYYVSVGLQPGTVATSGAPFQPRIETDLARIDLDPFACVVLANVGSVSEEVAKKLEGYVADGGSLVIFLGDRVDPDAYNKLLYRNGAGILPAKLGGLLPSDDVAVGFDPRHYKDPIIALFEVLPKAGLLSVRTKRYYQLQLSAVDRQAGIRIPLGFKDPERSPAIVIKPYARGTGQVALVATSADEEWTDWPGQPSFLPVLQLLTYDMIRDRTRQVSLQVGQELTLPVRASMAGRDAWIQVPADATRRRPLKVAAGTGDLNRAFLRYKETGQCGVYRLGIDGVNDELRHICAVNIDASEGDLAKLNRDDLAGIIGSDVFNYLSGTQEVDTKLLEAAVQADLYRYFFFVVLVLVVLESILAWRFGHWSEAA